MNRRKGFLDKAMCSNTNFKNNTQDNWNDECHLLSIGSNDEWIFEEKFLADHSDNNVEVESKSNEDKFNDIITETALQNK